MVPLLLARQRLLAEAVRKPRALWPATTATACRCWRRSRARTARELRNAGYETTALFGSNVTEEAVPPAWRGTTSFYGEGHYSTLFRDWRLREWEEPMAPSLVFLQSCLALRESKAQPLIRPRSRGRHRFVDAHLLRVRRRGVAGLLRRCRLRWRVGRCGPAAIEEFPPRLLAVEGEASRQGRAADRRESARRLGLHHSGAIRRCICRSRRWPPMRRHR